MFVVQFKCYARAGGLQCKIITNLNFEKMKELKLEELNEVKGGYHIVWTGGEMLEHQIGTGNIGTYVDGLNMGTDGYEDAY